MSPKKPRGKVGKKSLRANPPEEAAIPDVTNAKEIKSHCMKVPRDEVCSEKDGMVAIIYDEKMQGHIPENPAFYENPERTVTILDTWRRLGLLNRCTIYSSEHVEDKYLLAVHDPEHINTIKTVSSKDKSTRNKTARILGGKDIYFSEGSSEAALLAAGGVVKACKLVATSQHKYAFALIRPPGHHAGRHRPAGFCLFNNIATGAAYLLLEHGMKRILILDWDYHHGDGTQEIFYENPHVLYFSVHRTGAGCYAGGAYANHDKIGKGIGKGFNINFCLTQRGATDDDYYAVWDHLLLPIVDEFKPEIILVSAGFDAVAGDRIGDCFLTPEGYGILLSKIMKWGRVILALEGGYNLEATSLAAAQCLEVLMGKVPSAPLSYDPSSTTWIEILKVRKLLKLFWPVLGSNICEAVASRPWLRKSKSKSTLETSKRVPAKCLVNNNVPVGDADPQKVLNQKGCVVWITGLSGSGKSTLACTLIQKLRSRGKLAYVLDDDDLKDGLNNDLGSGTVPEDAVEHTRRIAEVARLFADAGLVCIASVVSPHRRDHLSSRKLLPDDSFIEVFLNMPLELCEARDPKGLYKLARAGKIKGLVGVDVPYEPSLNYEIEIKGDGVCPSPSDMAGQVIAYLEERGFLQ